MAQPIPPELPIEEAFMRIMNRLHGRWRAIIFLPITYLLLGLLISQFYFEAERGGAGFLPLSDGTRTIVLFVGGAWVVFLWLLASRLRMRETVALAEISEKPNDFLGRALEHQWIQFAVCDAVALPGIILFLLDNDLFGLFAFVMISSVFYLRTMPSAKRLGLAMFHPEQHRDV